MNPERLSGDGSARRASVGCFYPSGSDGICLFGTGGPNAHFPTYTKSDPDPEPHADGTSIANHARSDVRPRGG